MAFTTPYEHRGFTYPEAYINVTLNRLDKNEMVANLNIYANTQCKQDGYQPIVVDNKVLSTDLDNWTGNPLANAYNKLEASGEWPNATWNV